MYKLDNLIISGFEVYNVPQPLGRALTEREPPRRAPRGAGLLQTLLMHTLAVGGLPLPASPRKR